MTQKTFLGFVRGKGRAGVRNKVLLLPIDRYSNQVAWQIGRIVADVTVFPCAGDMGRHAADRERLFTITSGMATNPNIYGVILIGVKPDFNYPEMRAERIIQRIRDSGRPVESIMINEAGGVGQSAQRGQIAARRMVRDASGQQRALVPLGQLALGIKCGVSDGTSGISGNPALGAAVDRLIAAGGAALFSETTEIIGAEHLLAKRALTPEVGETILKMAKRCEERALSVGEDIRSINPIPSNLKAGITTLEEKSLGSIIKGGSTPLAGALEYAAPIPGPGLYFMDGWMATNSLLLTLAATGCQIVILQAGGGDLPYDPPIPVINSGVAAPAFFMTGNPVFAHNTPIGIDFDSSGILSGAADVATTGERLLDTLIAAAEGRRTWGETLQYTEDLEIWFDGPFF
ncbi:MAG: UxaA family hydrolase [Desulfovibrio sp.]|jgi:altronate dehydratase large subunit|nr:UxaA family hydrolase [Desulfovibrio sp.]